MMSWRAGSPCLDLLACHSNLGGDYCRTHGRGTHATVDQQHSEATSRYAAVGGVFPPGGGLRAEAARAPPDPRHRRQHRRAPGTCGIIYLEHALEMTPARSLEIVAGCYFRAPTQQHKSHGRARSFLAATRSACALYHAEKGARQPAAGVEGVAAAAEPSGEQQMEATDGAGERVGVGAAPADRSTQGAGPHEAMPRRGAHVQHACGAACYAAAAR